jgi:quercetin dioxygenase-like cupin family protein
MNIAAEMTAHTDLILSSVQRLKAASVKVESGKLNFDNASRMDVFSSADGWVLYDGIDGVITRIVKRDQELKAAKIECHWIRSGVIPPHYHKEEELMTVTQGSMTLWVEVSGKVMEIPLTEGMSFNIVSDQTHAGYVHAGCKYTLDFHPPIATTG